MSLSKLTSRISPLLFRHRPLPPSLLRPLSTARRTPPRVDIGLRARQLQTRRLWTYALTFAGIAGFAVVVVNTFQDSMVFYVTPTDALRKHEEDPRVSKFRLGGLVLEGSVTHPPNCNQIEFIITDLITDVLVRLGGLVLEGSVMHPPNCNQIEFIITDLITDVLVRLGGLVLERSVTHLPNCNQIEFIITDLITDVLVRFEGSLPDLFREGHSVVVEGFVKAMPDEIRRECGKKGVDTKARTGECFFEATEVLAKHDEKYMPREVAEAIEKNKKKIEAGLVEAHQQEKAQS